MILAFCPVWVQAQNRTIELHTIYTGLNNPTSIYATKDALFVVEQGKNRIVKFSFEGKELATLGGLGSGDYQFDTPVDVDATNGLKIFVSDYENGRVQVFDRRFQYLSSIKAKGDFGRKRTFRPTQIAVNGYGEVFIYDKGNKEFLKFDQKGTQLDAFPRPEQIKQVDGIRIIGKDVYIFDSQTHLYYVLSENGLVWKSYPANDAVSVWIDDDGTEWIISEENVYPVKTLGREIPFGKKLKARDAVKIGDAFFMINEASLIKLMTEN